MQSCGELSVLQSCGGEWREAFLYVQLIVCFGSRVGLRDCTAVSQEQLVSSGVIHAGALC